MIGMQVVLKMAQLLVRITGVLLLLLGLLIWTESGARGALVGIHILLGLLLVIALWVLAAVAARLGAPLGMTAGLAVLALIVVWLGLNQDSLLPGPNHWLIEVLHLLLGMAAVGFAEALGGRLRRAQLA